MPAINKIMHESHEPQILRQLREKSLQLASSIDTLRNQTKQKQAKKQTLQAQLAKLQQEMQVQTKKNKSLVVLLNELQNSYNSDYLQQKELSGGDVTELALENSLLRFLLVGTTEQIKESEKAANFMKHLLLDKNKGKTKQFIKKSNFLETQSELIAKLRSQINLLRNDNLECKRKWYTLKQESKRLESHNKLLSIQNQRQKTEAKCMYEDYLESINESKTRVVSYNETQRDAVINEYFVKEVAVLQQKRAQAEQESQNLEYHCQNLSTEWERIQVENRELSSFFTEAGQQGALATKMKKRIEQLRDVLIEYQKRNKNLRLNKVTKTLENIKQMHRHYIESNDFLQVRVRDQENHGSFLQEKPLAEFFSRLLEEQDQKLILMREQEAALKQRLRELSMKRELLANQISHLEENVELGSFDNKYKETMNWRSISSGSGPQVKEYKVPEFGRSTTSLKKNSVNSSYYDKFS